MYKMAVIGDIDSIYGFASLGLSVFDTTEENEALKIISELVKSNFAVIYITEPLFEKISEKLEKFTDLATPAIIPIPAISGNSGIGMKNVSRFVERAVGSDIIS